MATSGGFVIKIEAIDAATKKIEEVNKALHHLNAPVERFGKSLKKLGEQTHITEAFNKTKEAIGGAFEKLAEFVPMIGLLTAGGIAAGLAEIVHGWSTFATQLGITSKWLGVMPDQLQTLQNATRLAGGSAAEANAMYEKLDDTLQDAAAGRNHEAAMRLTAMGIEFRKGALQAKSAAEVLPQIFERLHTMGGSDATKRRLAASFGITGAAYKVALEEGAAGLARLQEEARKHGVLSKENTDILEKEHEAFTGLTLSIENFTSKIAVGLAPQILDLIERFEAWLRNGKNVDDTVKTITHTVEQLVTWSTWLFEKVNSVVQVFGGWKNVIEGIIALKLTGFIIGLVAPFVQLAAAITQCATATELLSQKANLMAANPAIRTLMVLLSLYDKVQNKDFTLENLPQNSPLRRGLEPEGQGGSGGGSWWSRNMPRWLGGGSSAAGTSTTVDTSIPAVGRALMDTVADKESKGDYNAKNPTSSAKGRYQFIDSTWERVAAITGRHERTPENQDINAWWLMRDDYRKRTGGDLEADLRDPTKRDKVVAGLRATWPSLPGGSQTLGNQDDFNKRLETHLAQENARVAPSLAQAEGKPVGKLGWQGNSTVDGKVAIEVNNNSGNTVTATSSGRNVATPRINTAMQPYGGGLANAI